MLCYALKRILLKLARTHALTFTHPPVHPPTSALPVVSVRLWTSIFRDTKSCSSPLGHLYTRLRRPILLTLLLVDWHCTTIMGKSREIPNEESMTPAIFEHGSNIGPDIASALDCEHLDTDLYRSSQVGRRSAADDRRLAPDYVR